jgi:5-methylcytosine-specific restriction endonuclease McrA
VFKLRETNNPSQEPTATLILQRLIKDRYGDRIPPKRISKRFREDFAGKLVEPPAGWGHSVFTYVLPCWQGATKNARGYYVYPKLGSNDFFKYSVDDGTLNLSHKFEETLKQHRSTLISLVILEWARFLEKFNQTPNLISKLSPKKPLRRLSKFRPIFKETIIMKAGICHLCRKPIPKGDLTLDHIIPFDYIYADDLWNLVPAHRRCNSKKGARVGSDRMIQELIERNNLFWDQKDTAAQKWMQFSGESAKDLENKIVSFADMAINAGFKQVSNEEFHE